jgi:hypothetical protein
MRKKRAAGVAVAMASAISLVGGVSAQVYAATPRPDSSGTVAPLGTGCSGGLACFWSNVSRGGNKGEVADNNSNYLNLHNSWGCTRFPGTWNDCIMSIANSGIQCRVYFWTNAGYKGRYHSLEMGDSVDNFGTDPYYDPSFANAISSNHWCTPN